MANLLLQRYDHYAGSLGDRTARVGEIFYRLFSGELNGSMGSDLALLLPGEHPSGRLVRSYNLSQGTLWRSICALCMATFAARCTYAEWLGLPVDPEARRLHIHHVDLAAWKWTEGR